MRGSSTNYASQGRILRAGDPSCVQSISNHRVVSNDDQRSSRNDVRVRPVVFAVILSALFAMVCGYQSSLFISDPVEGETAVPALISSDALQRAVIEYQRPDLARRIADSAAIPVPPTLKKSSLPLVSIEPELELPKKPVKRLSHKHLVEKVYGIIKTHAPKHQNGRTLADAIVTEATAQQYDPLFVAAVIKSESTFNAMARSHKGAQGLMQIMPKTGAWLAKKEEMPRGSLTDPGYNLKLGITYLKHLEEMFNGNRVFVLIAYNWGPGHVESASEGKRKVPSEVVSYAVKIMNDFRRWSHFA